MDVRPLRYFVEVVRQRSFTRAAELLHISQPSISKMVKNLEEELGVNLLDRSARTVTLTDAGAVVYARAQQVVSSLDDLGAELSDLMGLNRGTVRVGMPPMVGAAFFPAIIAGFRAQYPHINILLFEHGAKRVEEEVAGGNLDVGVALLPVDERLESFPFVREQLRLLVHPGHRLATRGAAVLADLDGEPLIIFREDFALHGRILRECEQAGVRVSVVCESSHWDFIGEMVAAGLGLALLPETICRRLDQGRVTVLPLTAPVIPWPLAIVWPRDRYLSFAARGWLAYAQAHLSPLA